MDKPETYTFLNSNHLDLEPPLSPAYGAGFSRIKKKDPIKKSPLLPKSRKMLSFPFRFVPTAFPSYSTFDSKFSPSTRSGMSSSSSSFFWSW